MNILHINTNYINTALHQIMIEHLSKNGVNSTIFAPVCKEDIAQKVIDPNEDTIVAECFNHNDRFLYPIKQKKIYNCLIDSVSIEKYDVIHAYTLFTDGNCAMKLSKKYGIPYVVAIRDTDVNYFFKYMIHLRHLGIEIIKNASAVFFLSETYRQHVFNKYIPVKLKEYISNKTYVVPNGIDDFWIKNIFTSKCNQEIRDEIRIVFAGKINKRKNPLATAKAIKRLTDKGLKVKFSISGKNEDDGIFKRLKEYPFVEYLGVNNKEQLMSIYRESDIFVMPSLTETFGLVYAEAMSQGLPVVYTKGQGFDGQFPDGTVGEKVNPTSDEEISDAIIRIINNYQMYRLNCIKGCKNFDWNTICKKYISLYERIISRKSDSIIT